MNATPDPLVELSVQIEASPETVWAILTTPSRFSEWMEGIVEFETREGSPFRIDFPRFQTVVVGEIARLDEGERVMAITWGVESGHQAETLPPGSSLVEFHVLDDPDGARVELRHTGLPSVLDAERQGEGWRFHFSRLALFANRADMSAGLERTLAGWFAAWNETDDDARLEILRACCAEDVEFRDDWALASGVELLNMHIHNTLEFVPGWRLEPTGDVRICRGQALFGWRGVGPGGQSMEGMNHTEARADGTLLRVSGFAQA